MKVVYLWSLALAAVGTVQGEEEVSASQNVRTSYEYEVMTSNMVYTRTIPRYITLTNEQGYATATILSSSAETTSTHSTKTTKIAKTTMTTDIPMTTTAVTKVVTEVVTSCSGNPACTNGQVMTKTTVYTTTCPVSEIRDSTVLSTSTQTVVPIPAYTGLPGDGTGYNSTVSQNSGAAATSKPVLIPTGYIKTPVNDSSASNISSTTSSRPNLAPYGTAVYKPVLIPTGYSSKPVNNTSDYNLSSTSVSQNSGATTSSRPNLIPYGTGYIATPLNTSAVSENSGVTATRKPLYPTGVHAPSSGIKAPIYDPGPFANDTSKPSVTSRPAYLPSGYGISPLATSKPGPYANITSAPLTTSTVYTTRVNTVTKCPPTAKNCPVGAVVTETIPLYTTVCPVSEVQPTHIVSTKLEVTTPAYGGPVITITSIITLPYPTAAIPTPQPYGPVGGYPGVTVSKNSGAIPTPQPYEPVGEYPGVTPVPEHGGAIPTRPSGFYLTTMISVISAPEGGVTTITQIRTATNTVTATKTGLLAYPTSGGGKTHEGSTGGSTGGSIKGDACPPQEACPPRDACPPAPVTYDGGDFPAAGLPYRSGAKITMDGMVYVLPANATGILKAMGYAPIATAAAVTSASGNYTKPGATGTGAMKPYGTGNVKAYGTGVARPSGTGARRFYPTGGARLY